MRAKAEGTLQTEESISSADALAAAAGGADDGSGGGGGGGGGVVEPTQPTSAAAAISTTSTTSSSSSSSHRHNCLTASPQEEQLHHARRHMRRLLELVQREAVPFIGAAYDHFAEDCPDLGVVASAYLRALGTRIRWQYNYACDGDGGYVSDSA